MKNTILMALFVMGFDGTIAFGQGGSTSEFCAKESFRRCPDDVPPNCGTIFGQRPAPAWVVNPANQCERIPVYDWSQACPANSTEPCEYNDDGYTICNPDSSRPGSGQDDSEDYEVICWKIRACSSSCTQSTIPDGVIDTMPNEPYPNGCPSTFIARKFPLFKSKCDSGVGNGDVAFELQWKKVNGERCTGEKKPCRVMAE